MIQEVKFQGLTHSPSDNKSQDGELGTCLNLINEDGALKPISQPEVAENFTLPNSTCSIKYVHKVTHGDESHSHYIVNCANGSPYSWYWTEKGGNGAQNLIDLGSFKVNAVTAVGNILCFVGENSILYAFWKEQSYKVFSVENFKYSVSVKQKPSFYNIDVNLGDDFDKCFNSGCWGVDKDATRYITGVNASQIANLRSFMESGVNKEAESVSPYAVKHLVFGVAALRMYDGSHINISNIFPLYPQYIDNEVKINASTRKITFKAAISIHEISVNLDTSLINDFVQGIDIYITKGESFLDNKDSYSYSDITYETIGINSSQIQTGTLTLHRQDETEVKNTIDGLVFYHSIFIDKKNFDTFLKVNRPLETEESISLADFKRFSYGGECAITYNNRLHIANVKNGKIDEFSFFPGNIYYVDSDFGSGFGVVKITKILGYYPDLEKNGDDYDKNGTMVEMVAKVQAASTTDYYYGKCNYPLPPIFMFPKDNCISATLYMKLNGEYFRKSTSLISSDTFGMSYFVTFDDSGSIRNLQVYDREEYDGDKTNNGLWETSSESEYNAMVSEYGKYSTSTPYPSLVKVSEAENPLTFPASNSVQVGSTTIKALAANTRPISEGQFGDAPLYAFTDEGVWVLMLGSEGTYMSRQPANRDICTNTDGILQIDDAVLYTTDRGIMMQQGRSSACISDSLDGYPFDFTQMPSASKVLNVEGIPSQDIKYTRFRNYLEGANMIYDYYDNRIIVFNPNYSYAYVYSLKSKMWGTMESNFTQRINIYPESYAINSNNQIVNVYAKNPAVDVPYFACTRPLSLQASNVHKTMLSAITRGYFRNLPSGKCGMVLYGSNDLFKWYLVSSSVNQFLRGKAGTPYKYFRVALIGNLGVDETIEGLSTDIITRLSNKLR
jgi:hypothetical protein